MRATTRFLARGSHTGLWIALRYWKYKYGAPIPQDHWLYGSDVEIEEVGANADTVSDSGAKDPTLPDDGDLPKDGYDTSDKSWWRHYMEEEHYNVDPGADTIEVVSLPPLLKRKAESWTKDTNGKGC